MKLVTKEIKRLLDSNNEKSAEDRVPYLKLFNPCGSATWLITEYHEGEGRFFGLFVGLPSIETVPFCGMSRPLRQRANVVLPDPFDPIMAVNSPGRICKLIDFRTGILTKWKLALISSIMGERG